MSGEVYLRITEPGRKPHVECHWTWDAERFIKSVRDTRAAEAEKKKQPAPTIEVVDKETYQRANGYKMPNEKGRK